MLNILRRNSQKRVISGKIADTIQNRRSIRNFSRKPIDTELLLNILNQAVYAPFHSNEEPWGFILFETEGMSLFSDAVLSTYPESDRRKNADKIHKYYSSIPATLIVTMKNEEDQKKWEEGLSAVSALIQNIQLICWEHSIGVVWKTNSYNSHETFRQLAGIVDHEKIVGTLHIGYIHKIPKARTRRDVREYIRLRS